MSSYHYFGIFAALTFMFTVLGLYYQLALVLKRRILFLENSLEQERPTSILSLNQLTSIFLACYVFFLYGICVTPINHYLAWPRFIAMLILLQLFYQILINRRNLWSRVVFYLACSMLVASSLVFWFIDYMQQSIKYLA